MVRLVSSLANTSTDQTLDKVVVQSHCKTLVCNINDLDTADNAATFTETLKILVVAQETLH